MLGGAGRPPGGQPLIIRKAGGTVPPVGKRRYTGGEITVENPSSGTGDKSTEGKILNQRLNLADIACYK
jgi:hypothetical protein